MVINKQYILQPYGLPILSVGRKGHMTTNHLCPSETQLPKLHDNCVYRREPAPNTHFTDARYLFTVALGTKRALQVNFLC